MMDESFDNRASLMKSTIRKVYPIHLSLYQTQSEFNKALRSNNKGFPMFYPFHRASSDICLFKDGERSTFTLDVLLRYQRSIFPA